MMSGLDVHVPNKKSKRVKDDNMHGQSYKIFSQKEFKSIKECIKQFHSDIAVGPLFVCICCHQTSVLCYKRSTSQHRVKNFTAQNLHLFIMKNGFVTPT